MSKSIKLKNNTFFNGEICDMGTNNNGTYIKWANGLMICYGTKTLSNISVRTQWGNLCVSSKKDGYEFPYDFITSPIVLYSLESIYTCWVMASSISTKNKSASYYLVTSGGLDLASGNINYIAIGKWK